MAIIDIGTFDLATSIPAGSNDWKQAMDWNLIKMSTLQQLSVASRSTPIPETAANGTVLIDPASHYLYAHYNGDWYVMAPRNGGWAWVQDEKAFVTYSVAAQDWIVVFDLDAPPVPLPRTLAFYNPGKVYPSAQLFRYMSAIEFVVPVGAPGSLAKLDVAPSAPIVFTARGDSISDFTISFAANSTVGVVSAPNGAMIYEGFTFDIMSPSNVYGAEGLAVSLAGQVVLVDA